MTRRSVTFLALVSASLFSVAQDATQSNTNISEPNGLIVTGLAGFRPTRTWNDVDTYRFKTGLRVEYSLPDAKWLSVGVEYFYSQRVISKFNLTTGEQWDEYYPQHTFYGRVDLHPIQMFNPNSPFDLYLGAGYGYYRTNGIDDSWGEEFDMALQGGFRYWITRNWGASLEVGVREQSHILLGANYRF